MNDLRISTKTVVLLGFSLAVLEASKLALDMFPNIELITILFIVYAIFYGKKTLLIALGFILIESCLKGVHLWVLMYLYMWPTLILIVCFAHKHGAGHLFYCILSGFFGLFFGFFCAIPYLFIGGIHMAFTWWIAGIPYDIIHCVSNTVICLILFRPLCGIMKKMLPDQGISV